MLPFVVNVDEYKLCLIVAAMQQQRHQLLILTEETNEFIFVLFFRENQSGYRY